jgi:uncharacterized protein YfaS (alpha-2-macroglobulin family)
VTVGSSERRYHVAVTDYLPAGFEPIQTRFATTSSMIDRPAGESEQERWYLASKEIHDDRVEAFFEYLWPGEHTFSYLAKATATGTFVVAGSHAEAMYQPDVRAVLAPARFEVRAP